MRFPWEFEQPLCSQVGTDIFFSADSDDPEYANVVGTAYEEARKICNTCVHKLECAEYGLKYETHGMWGGLTPKDRVNIKRNLKRRAGKMYTTYSM